MFTAKSSAEFIDMRSSHFQSDVALIELPQYLAALSDLDYPAIVNFNDRIFCDVARSAVGRAAGIRRSADVHNFVVHSVTLDAFKTYPASEPRVFDGDLMLAEFAHAIASAVGSHPVTLTRERQAVNL
jgi:hypothetical protein